MKLLALLPCILIQARLWSTAHASEVATGDSLEEQFERALKDCTEMNLFLAANRDYKVPEDSMALHLAIKDGRRSVALSLIEHDVNLNFAGGPDNWTPLHFAVNAGDRDMVLSLIWPGYAMGKSKADQSLRDSEGCTPLNLACRLASEIPDGDFNPFVLCFEQLLRVDGGWDQLLVPDNKGFTPMHYVIVAVANRKSYSVRLCKFLSEHFSRGIDCAVSESDEAATADDTAK